MEFFDNLDPLLRTFWFVAIPASIVFTFQTVMTFLGGDATDGLDADFDGDLEGSDEPFQLFSLRNLINFLLGFGWTGVSFFSTIHSHTLLIVLATLVGAGFVFLFFIIIRQMQKLAEDNSFQFSDTLNKTAEVYLRIPANKTGMGKILISNRGSVRELPAMTDGEEIASGATVIVVKIENENILIVKTLS